MALKGYRDLVVWQKSMDLADKIYDITQPFPREEIFGLTSQARRSALSIPSNIAEGSARHGSKEFVQFLSIAKGSLAELETQMNLAVRRKFITETQWKEISEMCDEIDRMIYGLQNSLKKAV